MRQIEAMRRKLTSVRRGVFDETDVEGWDLYRLKCQAVVRAISGAVLAGPSAAAMWDLNLVGDPPAKVYIRGVQRGRYGKDVCILAGGEMVVEDRNGVPLTSVAWAVIDCARLLSRRDALIVCDDALHKGACSQRELAAACTTLGPVKNIQQVRWVIGNCDPKSESAGETWLRMVVRDLGFEVRTQVWIRDGSFRARVDFLLQGVPVVLEFDGMIKYDDEDPEAVQLTIAGERRRHARLERLGYQVLRFLWEDLFDPQGVKLRIDAALERHM